MPKPFALKRFWTGACVAWVLAWLCASPAAVFADVIHLKNGNRLEGTIQSQTANEVVIEIDGLGRMTLRPNEIVSIETDQPAAKFSMPSIMPDDTPEPAATVDPEPVPVYEPEPAQLTAPSSEPSGSSALAGFSVPVTMTLPDGRVIDQQVSGWPLVGGLLVCLVLYLYYAGCLYLIASKLGVENAWLAWVPVLSGFVVWWCAGWPAWTLILGSILVVGGTIINPFIVFVLIPVFLGLQVWWAIRVAVARRKPFWVGLLFLLPAVQWLIWGYLAFSNGEQSSSGSSGARVEKLPDGTYVDRSHPGSTEPTAPPPPISS